MKILIDGQTLLTPDIKRGIGTYFRHTVETVLANDLSNDFYLNTRAGDHLAHLSPWAREKLCLIDAPAHDNHSAPQFRPEDLAKRYSDALNNEIEKRGIDVYWSPNGLMDNVFLPERKVSSCRFAVTIFDLIVLVMAREYAKHLSASAMASYKKRLRVLEEDYDLFFHISQHTRSDFTTRLRVGDKQHVVTPLAADSSFRPYPFPTVSAGKDYVVYTGGLDPRKNMDRALEGFAALHNRYSADQRIRNTELTVVCVMDDIAKTRMLRRAGLLGLDGKVSFTGFIDDAALLELYQKARCLFFPSLYEGFGLPILEGLACGLPVAAANTSSLPEVGGEWAIYFDPLNIEEMADSLYQALQAPMDLQSRLARYEYSKNFSWQKTARATLDAFEDGAGQTRAPRESAVSNNMKSKESDNLDLIDVRQRMAEMTVEELTETAEEFFARLNNWDYLHSKPFAAINETPELLTCFAQVVHGLSLLPDMTILDFGAGSCWTSRFLSQLGLHVIACDVSPTALKIGEELYRRHPLVGNQPEPRFLLFDGHHLDLPDKSLDRISCWEAFHHVSNPAHVLKEMGRVLKDGGIAGFSEPGPHHSKAPQSQFEMRTNRLIENDVNAGEIWAAAQEAGFTEIKLSLFNPEPFLLGLDEFEASLNEGDLGKRYVAAMREQMKHRRVFFLFKGKSSTPADSRQRDGLMAQLKVDLESDRVAAGSAVRLKVRVKNSGRNVWLPTTARVGAVHFGVHLFDQNAVLLDLDYFRHNLTPGEGRQIMPGEELRFDVSVPTPPAGVYTMQCDLVSEGVCWFEHNGSLTVRLLVEVE